MIELNNVRKNHHYVSQSYLKAWSNKHKNIWHYRTLVSHKSVPLWSQSSIKSIANQYQLFTRTVAGNDSDDFEIWMDQEIETPAQTALSNIRCGKSLSSDEWDCLLRYLVLHDIRSPVFYVEGIERWKLEMPDLLERVIQDAVSKMTEAVETQKESTIEYNKKSELIPLKVSKEVVADSDYGGLRAEVLLGRGLWLFSIKHLLTSTYQVLKQHNWSVIKAPEGLEWLTSDNPVLKLNYYGSGSYDFKGGWGNKGTEIIFPLSPNLLLYTMVGRKEGISNMSNELAMTVNRLISENAYKSIFAFTPVDDIQSIVPRVVDEVAFREDKMKWEEWHTIQRELEAEYQPSNIANQ